jgi:hypothetical protein
MPGGGQIFVPRDKLGSSVGERLAGQARQEVMIARSQRPLAERRGWRSRSRFSDMHFGTKLRQLGMPLPIRGREGREVDRD